MLRALPLTALLLAGGALSAQAATAPAPLAVASASAETVPVLRAYLRRWAWEVGAFFDGVGPDSSDDELAAAAHRHPVFVLHP